MATVSIRKAKQSITSKGFSEDEEDHHEDSHTYFRLYIDGEPTQIETHISGRPDGDDLRNNELKAMKLQMGFNNSGELFDYLRCTMRKDQYIELLRENDSIE
jgi:hypothetical protein